jgi:glycosyltransferase involved in cell wall biosynthesis
MILPLDGRAASEAALSEPGGSNGPPGRRLVILTGLDIRAFRGGEKYAIALARELSARGVGVTLFSKVDPHEHRRLSEVALGEKVPVPIAFYRLFLVPFLPPILLNPFAFLRMLARHDTVYTLESTPRSVAFVVFVSKLLGKRTVVGLHHPSQAEAFAGELTRRRSLRIRARIFRFVLRRADAIHAINVHQVASMYRAGLGKNVVLVHNFVQVKPIPRPAGASTAFEVLFVGALEREQKGVDLLVELARRLLPARPDLRLRIVGTGPDTGLVTDLAREFPDRVKHLGFVEEGRLPRRSRRRTSSG